MYKQKQITNNMHIKHYLKPNKINKNATTIKQIKNHNKNSLNYPVHTKNHIHNQIQKYIYTSFSSPINTNQQVQTTQ